MCELNQSYKSVTGGTRTPEPIKGADLQSAAIATLPLLHKKWTKIVIGFSLEKIGFLITNIRRSKMAAFRVARKLRSL